MLMTLIDRIVLDITGIKSPSVLNQVFELIQLFKQGEAMEKSNKDEVLRFAGTMNNEDANDINAIIDAEFNGIEGDWS